MTDPKGMTIKQFKDEVEKMRKCYPFKDEDAVLGNMIGIASCCINHIEIHTNDEDTGTHVILTKDVEIGW